MCHRQPPPSFNADGSLAGGATLNIEGMHFEAPSFDDYPDLLRQRDLTEAGIEVPAVNRYLDPRAEENELVRPYGMGPRVPMYVVSPWIKGGWVSSQVFDHSSVGPFLERRFGIMIAAIARRIGECDAETPHEAVASDPFEPDTSGEIERDGKVKLRFVSAGRQGVVFHVYDKLHLDRIPRHYTAEAGKTLEDNAWNAAADSGAYHLEVYGPSGFLRRFAGDVKTSAALDIRVEYDVPGGNIRAELRNTEAIAVNAKIVANAYRSAAPETASLAPNGSLEKSWPVGDSGNWYDFTVRATGVERCFAGRMENGRNLTSDPAMAT